jgi:hypothetical protein
MRGSIFVVALVMSAFAHGQSATTPTSHEQRQEPSGAHASGVDMRGDHAMGFSHEASTHHFRFLSDGGAIEVTANDPNDKITRDEIKNHLPISLKCSQTGISRFRCSFMTPCHLEYQ